MTNVIAVIHVIVCLLLIGLVLLQDPKSSGAGGVFGGGGTNSLLGATGAVTFLTRLTRYSAIIFGITCLILTLLSRPNTGSVIDSMPATAQPPQPTATIPTTNPGSAPNNVPGVTAPAAPVEPAAPAPAAK